jgi:NAD(P)-dependent dehydrogenase (short-subunit alcohol dehydrogenase family)
MMCVTDYLLTPTREKRLMSGELQLDMSDEVIVITGGAGILCGTFAEALAARGASVAILDIDEDAARKQADKIKDDGGTAMAVKVNVLKREELEDAAARIQDTLGRPTVLINGAGGNKAEATTGDDREFYDLSAEATRFVFDLNFLGTFLPSQVFGKVFTDSDKGGHIINVSSMNAFRPLTRIPAYSAAKAAVSNFTQWLAVHMSQNYDNKVRVNAIAPGFFLTQQNRFLLIEEDTGELTPRGQTIINHTPMARFGKPEELVGTLLWLLSDSSAFVHGVVVPVDGGFNAFSGV